MNGIEGQGPKCYIIFDYAWHLTGVKPVRNYFKSFASINEAGEYLISLFSRDFSEGVFESLLPKEEIDEVNAAVAVLKQDFTANKTTNVELDLSCFEFKINAFCTWPNGAKEVLETIVDILKEGQEANFQKAQVLLRTETSTLDQEKFDEVFDYMIHSHMCKGVF